MSEPKFKIRIAPSLGGGFDGTPQECWGVETYNPEKDLNEPCVFFGVYGLPDLYAVWKHRGPKYILWAGSDILHFTRGYWLDTNGYTNANPHRLAPWIRTHCQCYVENELEQETLLKYGIKSKVVPSFLGDVKKYKINYKWSPHPKVYTSVSGDDFEVYGWSKIYDLAEQNPKVEFHLYGNSVNWIGKKNIIVHGKVSKERFNWETSQMQGALRLTKFDGFSEILCKSILWGQYPISPFIDYPHIQKDFKFHRKPNIKGRNYYKRILNKYPWNQNTHENQKHKTI